MTYATIEELEAGWRTLTPEERERAQTLLERASLYLDWVVDRYHIDPIAKRAALATVCCDLVQRKLETGSATPISSTTTTAGAFSETKTFKISGRKSWELYPEDLQLLGVSKKGGGMIKTAIHNAGGEQIEW